MKKILSTLLLAAVAMTATHSASAEVVSIGKAAPDFTLTDSNGKKHSLSDFKGKVVVLEWFNAECPFVKKHYKPGSMQKSQKSVVDDGGIWLTINSSAEGKQGHLSQSEAAESATKLGLNSSALLLDSDGKVGKLYGARVTPHIFVVAADGTLAYQGAIDSTASTDSDDIATSDNYVLTAVKDLKSMNKVSKSNTEPYGCGVKY